MTQNKERDKPHVVDIDESDCLMSAPLDDTSHLTEPLSKSDIDFVDEGIPAGLPSLGEADTEEDIDRFFGSQKQVADETPAPIRKLAENAPPDSGVPQVLMPQSQSRLVQPKFVVAIMAAMAGLVLLALIAYNAKSPKNVSATIPPADLVADVGPIDDYAVIVGAPVHEVAPSAESTAVYDEEKCANPKTDRALLECGAAAYAVLQLALEETQVENANLEAQITELKLQKPVSVAPVWIKYFGTFFILLIIIGLLIPVFRKRKKSGSSTL